MLQMENAKKITQAIVTLNDSRQLETLSNCIGKCRFEKVINNPTTNKVNEKPDVNRINNDSSTSNYDYLQVDYKLLTLHSGHELFLTNENLL